MTRILRYRWNRTCHSFYGESLEFTFDNRISLRNNVLFNCKIDKIAVSLSAMMRKMCIILLISTTIETLENSLLFYQYDFLLWYATKENRIYIRGEFTRKKCKTAILLYCFHTAGVLHIFMLYNLLGPGI